MIFYEANNKVGKAVQGWDNSTYPAEEPVMPRVYHEYLKDTDKANIYRPYPLNIVAQASESTVGNMVMAVFEDKRASTNTYAYAVDVALPIKYEDLTDNADYTAWNGGSEITPKAGSVLVLVELDADNKVVSVGTTAIVVKVAENQETVVTDDPQQPA